MTTRNVCMIQVACTLRKAGVLHDLDVYGDVLSTMGQTGLKLQFYSEWRVILRSNMRGPVSSPSSLK